MGPQEAYLVGIHRASFRAGKPAKIIGVKIVTPTGCPARPCFEIEFQDGRRDFTAVSEMVHYKIISANDVLAGRIPEVVN